MKSSNKFIYSKSMLLEECARQYFDSIKEEYAIHRKKNKAHAEDFLDMLHQFVMTEFWFDDMDVLFGPTIGRYQLSHQRELWMDRVISAQEDARRFLERF